MAGEDTAKWEQQIATAKAFFSSMSQEKFDAACADFDATMTKAMTPDKLRETWETIVAQVGKLESQGGSRVAVEQGYECVYLSLTFTGAALDLKTVFDKNGKITGIMFVPPK